MYYTCLEWGCSLCNQTTLITGWLVSGINWRGQSEIRSVWPFHITDSFCFRYDFDLDSRPAVNEKWLKDNFVAFSQSLIVLYKRLKWVFSDYLNVVTA